MWPFIYKDQIYQQPHLNQQNEWVINDKPLLSVIEEEPNVWLHIIRNPVPSNLSTYISGIAEKFEQEIPDHTLARIKVPSTEWEKSEKHRYVRIEFVHCANYDNYLLPFHQPDNQYCCYFIDIDKTIQNDSLMWYWNPDQPDASVEEHIWCGSNDIDIIYAPQINDDEKDKKIGYKDVIIQYLKHLNNSRLDEIEESSSEILKILCLRLRGKCRYGHHGQIVSVQGMISSSAWDVLLDNISNVIKHDPEYSKNKNLVSFKLTRRSLFVDLKINSVFTIRIFDEFGKEMKLMKNIKHSALYNDSANSYSTEVKQLLQKITNKYKKRKQIDNLCGCNGLRIVFNKNTKAIKLITNTFRSNFNIATFDVGKGIFPIKETLGRKTGW